MEKNLRVNLSTAISKYYISRCLLLIKSAIKFKNVYIYVLCYDSESKKILEKEITNKNVKFFSFKQLLDFDIHLKKIIKQRKLIDKIVTSRPIFLKFLFKKFNLKNVHLLDSDTYFFSDPNQLNYITKNKSVAYCDHNFSKKNLYLARIYGKYNGGYINIYNNKPGNIFLKKWSNLCKQWCEFNPNAGKFSDQKYLEDLRFNNSSIKIIKNCNINLAPWNLNNYKISKKKNIILVNNKKLIFYHFHGLRSVKKFFWILGISNYCYRLSNKYKKIIYKDYINKLSNCKYLNEFFWIKLKKNSTISYIKKIKPLINKIRYNDIYINLK